MIEAHSLTSAALITRLTRKAEKLAAAHGENVLRARKRDPWRWRRSRLLWPLFGRED